MNVQVIDVSRGSKAQLHFRACQLATTVVRSLLRNRGLRSFTLLLGSVFGSDDYVIFRVFGNRSFKVSLGDGYWIPPLLNFADYEPEISFVLSALMTEDHAFIDCGANLGWWSLFASTRIPSPKRIVAVEASPSMFGSLVENAQLNEGCFVCMNAAVWNRSGEDLVLTVEKNHPGRSTVKGRSKQRDRARFSTELTQSVTLDDIYETLPAPGGSVIVKLDVEGAELEALQGASSVLKDLDLLVYEDHGQEREPRVSRAVMGLGFRVFFCDRSFRVREMASPSSVKELKRDPKRGYNFFACRPGSRTHRELLRLANTPDG